MPQEFHKIICSKKITACLTPRLYSGIIQQLYNYFLNILGMAEQLENRVAALLRDQELTPNFDLNEQEEKMSFKSRYGIRDEIDRIERSVKNKIC